ncbi:MAG: hypothetical protein RIT81_45910 [Deltaproteobacteria bacterium]
MNPRNFAAISCGLLALCTGGSAYAQAWVGAPNSLSVSVGYNFAPSSAIIETDGQQLDDVPTTHQSFQFGAEYVTPIPGLAVSASVPLLAVQFNGNPADGAFLTPHGRNDDGDLHFVLQDFRLGARYAILEDPIALAVQVGASIPSHGYETQGFAAAGRGLTRGHFGLSVGRFLDPILPNLYFHARYDFSLSERYKTDSAATSDINQNYSDISAMVGYFIIPDLEVNIGTDIRITHGGLNFLEWEDNATAVQHFHDSLLNENVFLIGGGASYRILDNLAVYALARVFVGGTNTRNAHIFGGGLTLDVF